MLRSSLREMGDKLVVTIDGWIECSLYEMETNVVNYVVLKCVPGAIGEAQKVVINTTYFDSSTIRMMMGIYFMDALDNLLMK